MDTPLTAPTVVITTTFQVSFGQNINNSVGQLEYLSMAPAVDIAPIAGGIVGGMVLMICVILFLIFLKFAHRLCSRHQQLPLSFVSSGQDDEIEMNVNIVYQRSAGVHTESTEVVDHSYEKFSCEFEEKTMTASKMGQGIDHDQVNDHLYPKDRALDGKEIDQEDDDYYYGNVDLFTKHDKEDKMKNTGQTTVNTTHKSSEFEDIYDHLFPKIQ